MSILPIRQTRYRDQAIKPPAADIHAHRILILDFGAQYTQLIARRVREIGVYCEIHPWDMSDSEVRAFGATSRIAGWVHWPR